MSKFWSPIVSSLQPYVAGEQPRIDNLVKLNTNENPYGPSPKAIAAIEAEAGDRLRLYPDPASIRLRTAIANLHGVDIGEIFVGNGSDEVLAHTFQALLKHDRPLYSPDIGYSFYPVYGLLYGIKIKKIPLDDDFKVQLDDYDESAGAIILANPNAPTGIALSISEIEALVAGHPDIPVVIDEAYIDFGGESAIPLTRKYDNLLVIHTLSKSRSLAGMRVGFAIGQRPLIEALERVKDSFNSYPIDRLAEAGASTAIEDVDWFDATRSKVMQSRARVTGALGQRGFKVLPSQANFVFARHPQHQGSALAAGLRAQSVLVRHFAKPRIGDFLRISIGTDAECNRLIDAIDAVIGVK
jgi:histidinol-phosphate aminotransferase